MPERMPKIEKGAPTGLALILGDDGRFHAATRCNRVLARVPASKNFWPVRLQPGEEACISHQPVFYDFGVTRAEFASRQGVKQRRVRHDQDRLVKGVDPGLSPMRIYCRLFSSCGH